MDVSLEKIVAILELFSKAISGGKRIAGWLRGKASDDASTLKDVIALPLYATANGGRCYVRLYLLGARKRFGKGTIETKPSMEAIFFPDTSSGMQARASKTIGVDDRFLTLESGDPHYLVVFSLPEHEGEEICQRVRSNPHSMAALITGHIQIEAKKYIHEVKVVPLSLSLGNGILNEHQGPLV